MNKLKRKIFLLTYLILTISVLSFIITFNVQKYLEEKNTIINSLETALEMERKKDDPKEFKDYSIDNPKDELGHNSEIKFMDKAIYIILLNSDNSINDVINMGNNTISNKKIINIANNILDSKNISNRYIGCLYFNHYSYSYSNGEFLVIIDNSLVNKKLLTSLLISLILFIILEIIIYIISIVITNWIIKPVIDSFEKQKQFIQDASHELKTPLSVIIASSDALYKYPSETKWLINIKNEAVRMNNLVCDLLELASSENKELYHLTQNDLSKTIYLSLLTFEGRAFENDIKLEYDIDDDIITMYDENAIKQLIEILLDNAIKHADKKSTINLSLKCVNNNIKLNVTNVGDVIPKGEEDKIFERFYRVDKSRNRKENRYGLGLAIAKNIVLNHKGSISCCSRDGKTTFTVLLKKC